MSQEIIQQEQAVEPSVNVEQPQEFNLQEAIEKAKSEIRDEFKNEIAGLNRKNSELQKQLKEKDLEGKTEAEKNELLKQENEKIQNEIKTANRGRLIDKALHSAGLPLDFANRIMGEDEANINEDVSNFNKYIDDLAQERANKIINEKMGGSPPVAGANVNSDKTIKRNDFDAMGPLKQVEVMKQGVTIVD